jgi:hypothetical protein
MCKLNSKEAITKWAGVKKRKHTNEIQKQSILCNDNNNSVKLDADSRMSAVAPYNQALIPILIFSCPKQIPLCNCLSFTMSCGQ